MIWLERVVWVVAVFVLLACLAWAAVLETLLPDADDCRARGRAEDCWRDAP